MLYAKRTTTVYFRSVFLAEIEDSRLLTLTTIRGDGPLAASGAAPSEKSPARWSAGPERGVALQPASSCHPDL